MPVWAKLLRKWSRVNSPDFEFGCCALCHAEMDSRRDSVPSNQSSFCIKTSGRWISLFFQFTQRTLWTLSKIRYIKIEALPLGKMRDRGSSVHLTFRALHTRAPRHVPTQKKNRPPSRRYTLVTYAISTLRKRCTLFGTQGNQTLFRLSADPTPTLQRSSRTFVINVQVL